MADLLFQASEDGPFAMRIPPEFIKAVASIDDNRISEVAKRWGRTEELAFWHEADIIRALTELKTFATQAEGLTVLQVA